MKPQPGEVWLADLGLAAKSRPVVIVSRSDPEPPRALVIYVPLTAQNRNSKYEVAFQRYRSWIAHQLPTSKASHRFPRFACSTSSDNVSESALTHIKEAIKYALGI